MRAERFRGERAAGDDAKVGTSVEIARVHDRGDGTYRITYVASVSGNCTMAVTCGRQHIAGSPFKLTVKGAPPAARC